MTISNCRDSRGVSNLLVGFRQIDPIHQLLDVHRSLLQRAESLNSIA
jgi:hypothetical protein